MEDDEQSCEDCTYAMKPSLSRECKPCMQDPKHPNFTPWGGKR